MFITESVFYHNNYKCVVVFSFLGHRCGYVAVNPDHPLFGIHYNQDIKVILLGQEIKLLSLINVHGGITYSELSHHRNYPMPQFDKVWYFGFDCAHSLDGKDIQLAIKYFSYNHVKAYAEFEKRYPSNHLPIRSLSYVQKECRSLADQLDYIKEILIRTGI